ncbi:MAG: metallophosphoesterase [Sandaracinaceae bacterium]|nr:metallophosphoesterase [Sandaracinaceae bacterium]
MDTYDEIYSVSDLHLGGEGSGAQIFDSGSLLADTIRLVADRAGAGKRVALVLNGDIVDFLAEPGARYFDAVGAPAKLARIAADPAFAPVFTALAELTARERARLVLVLGNHDVELALPAVRDVLLSLVAKSDAAAGRVRIAMDGTGYACSAGGASTYFVHGNDVDPWNPVDQSALRRAITASNTASTIAPWEPNGGTQLVVDVMNGVKARYPFVDLLKPESKPLFAILLALDPGLVGKLGGIAKAWLTRQRTAPRLEGALESVSGLEALETDAELTEDRALAILLEDLAPAAQEAALEVVRVFGVVDLRKALVKWLRGDRTFDPSAEDDQFRALDARVGAHVRFVVTGHTHLCRAIKRKNGGAYFDSGTWARLIGLTGAMLADDPSFEPVFGALGKGTMAALDAFPDLVRRRPTVVCLAPDGAGQVFGELRIAKRGPDGVTLEPLAGTRLPAA